MFKQKVIKIFAVALAVMVALCAPLTASAATYNTNLSAKSEFGYSYTKTTVYCADDTAFLPTQVYINSYGNKDEITFIMPKPVNGKYYFAFSIKMLEDNYNGIEFDVEISDKKYKGQEYDQSILTVSSGNGYNSYNWFSGWFGSTELKGKVSDQNYINSNSTPIESKHYYIQQPSEGNKCNAYDFAFGVEFNSLYYSEVTFVIKNFKFIVPEYDEKVEANKSGNDSVDGVTSAIPDTDFAGIRDSLSLLTQAISYHGTDCMWTFPALYIPKIENPDTGQVIVPKIELTKERYIDLSAWVKKIPESVLLIIQALCSIAVILFIVYELYSFIVFCLTLKNDQVGKDEESED